MQWEYHVVHLNVDDSSSKHEEASNRGCKRKT